MNPHQLRTIRCKVLDIHRFPKTSSPGMDKPYIVPEPSKESFHLFDWSGYSDLNGFAKYIIAPHIFNPRFEFKALAAAER